MIIIITITVIILIFIIAANSEKDTTNNNFNNKRNNMKNNSKEEFENLKRKYPGGFQNIMAGETTVKLCIEDNEDYQSYIDDSFVSFDNAHLKELLPVHKKIKNTNQLTGNQKLSNDAIILAMERRLGHISVSDEINEDKINEITEDWLNDLLTGGTREEKIAGLGACIQLNDHDILLEKGIIKFIHPDLKVKPLNIQIAGLRVMINVGVEELIGKTIDTASLSDIRAALLVLEQSRAIKINI